MRTIICLLLVLTGLTALPATEGQPKAETQPQPQVFTDQEWSATQRPAAAPAASEGPGAGTAVSMLLGLVVVIAVAFALGWVVKRFNARRLITGNGKHLEVLETITIAPRRSLALVRCGTNWLVVGIGEREMITVATLPIPVETAVAATAPAAVAVTPTPPASAFAAVLGRLVTGGKA